MSRHNTFSNAAPNTLFVCAIAVSDEVLSFSRLAAEPVITSEYRAPKFPCRVVWTSAPGADPEGIMGWSASCKSSEAAPVPAPTTVKGWVGWLLGDS